MVSAAVGTALAPIQDPTLKALHRLDQGAMHFVCGNRESQFYLS